MSQSPVTQSQMQAAKPPESEYRQSIVRINKYIRRGGSLSGRERNCVFLNTGDPRFACVSAVTGLDVDDDSRALALADWDYDGDVDVWVTNRTAPVVRFFRNETPSGNHFLKLRLIGKTCNRDAIGARVEVVPGVAQGDLGTTDAITTDAAPASARPITRTLRAGEGYLGQSSKWLHFGLGSATAISTVTIRWPDGTNETLRDVQPDRHYVVRQASLRAEVWNPPSVRPQATTPTQPLMPTDAARVSLSHRLPMSRLTYRATDGQQHTIAGPLAKPALVNLWATWCGPCVKELRELTLAADSLEQAGVDVVAICVDVAATSESADAVEVNADKLLSDMEFPHRYGFGDAALVDAVEFACSSPFVQQRPLSVPLSLLIDREGRLAVIYRGPVEPSQVVADVERLARPDEERLSESLPFVGRWHSIPKPTRSLALAIHLMDQGRVAEADDLVSRFRREHVASVEFSKLAVWIGDEWIKRGNTSTGMAWLQDAVRLDPENAVTLNNLAWQLAAGDSRSARNGKLAVEYARRAVEKTGASDPLYLDTLAAAYAEAGNFTEAVATGRRALALAESTRQPSLAASLRTSLARYEQKQSQPAQRE